MLISCACLFGKAFPPNRTINVAYLTQQQQVQLLTSLAMTRLGRRIEPFTFSMPSGCTPYYAKDAVLIINFFQQVIFGKQANSHEFFTWKNIKLERLLFFQLFLQKVLPPYRIFSLLQCMCLVILIDLHIVQVRKRHTVNTVRNPSTQKLN